MADLGELHRVVFPSARPVGSMSIEPERWAREVTWVRVLKSRVPAFDALDSGDLAIIPSASLAIVAPGAIQSADLAAALARARVPAVLLVSGDDGGEHEAAALAMLGEAAAQSGLTVMRLDRTDPVALERSVIGFLVNRRAELARRATELEDELARLALLGRGLDPLAATIGAFFGRAIVIEGRRGDPIAVHAPPDMVGAAAAVSAYLARPDSAALRVPIQGPAGQPGNAGRLAVLGDDPPDEFVRVASERVVALLALELARDAAVRQAREEPRAGEVLPADGPPWVVAVARQRGGTDPGDVPDREQARADLRMLAPAGRLALRGTRDSLEIRLVIAAGTGDPDCLVIADRIAMLLGRTVAVSRPFVEAGARPAAEASARATLEAAELLHPAPAVARAARLPAYLLLGALHNLPDGLRQARDLLAPLMTGREATRRDRLATLRAVLETATLGEAAARLEVHRNTVAYRVARLEAIGGWDLSDPDLRLALTISVRLVQDAQPLAEAGD
jgi:hypothetical protein